MTAALTATLPAPAPERAAAERPVPPPVQGLIVAETERLLKAAGAKGRP